MDEARLAEYLSSQTGAAVAVLGSRRIHSSYSRVSYVVETSAGRCIVKMEQGDAASVSTSDEMQLMQWLHEAGVAVPRARRSEPIGDVLGKPFLVVDDLGAHRVDERSVEETAANAFVETLASLHRVGIPPHLPPVDPDLATHTQIEHWRNVAKWGGGPRVPVLEAAEIWLHHHAPLDKRLVLVHGAPRPNRLFMVAGEALALTDWDMAHLGDPGEDWSYSLFMRDMPPASRRLWQDLYERVAGVRMSAERWAYWDTFNAYKGACISRTCLALFETGQDLSPAMAIAGTQQYHSLLRRLLQTVD